MKQKLKTLKNLSESDIQQLPPEDSNLFEKYILDNRSKIRKERESKVFYFYYFEQSSNFNNYVWLNSAKMKLRRHIGENHDSADIYSEYVYIINISM